ncbi:MAG TPA: PilZ domain-containing protein [Polyangia bacterium]
MANPRDQCRVGTTEVDTTADKVEVPPNHWRFSKMLPYLEKPRELRRSARMKVEIAAKYVSDSLVVEGVVTDVSADGLFFCSDYLDGTGESVRVWLDIPWRNRPLELRGEVRWVNDTPNIGGMGIRFIDVSLEDRMVLSSLGLSALASGAYSSPGEA